MSEKHNNPLFGLNIDPSTNNLQRIDEIQRYYHVLKMDTFIFWSIMGEEEKQSRIFAEEVAPKVLEQL